MPEALRLPVIYQVPKIHKNQTNLPGRPIVSGVDFLYFQDCYLQPLAQRYSSYLTDNKELINILEEFQLEENFILATIYVDSLYTNIIEEDVLRAVNGL